MEIACRVCFKGFSTDSCFALSSFSGFPAVDTIENLLKNVIPEMNSALIEDSYICIPCWDIISQFYKLKMECLENEQNFYEFLAGNSWQGDINEFVFSTEMPKEEPVAEVEETVPVEEEEEEKPVTVTVNDSENGIKNPDFLSAHLEYRKKDGVNARDQFLDSIKEGNEVEVSNEILEEAKLLTCSSCQAECNNYKEALCHTTETHGVHTIMCCKFCTEFFMDCTALKEHAKIHLVEYVCQFCTNVYLTKRSLTAHLKTHAQFSPLKMQEGFKCTYCKRSFDNFEAFRRHRRKHFSTLYTCEFCGKSHATRQLLEEHRLIHSNLKRYMCEKCGQCFKQQSRLHWHNHRYHINIKTKQCPHCPKKFFKNYDLKMHQVVHTREKKYECTICGQRFTLRGNLTRHINTHTGRRFDCAKCGRSYAQNNDLKRHVCKEKPDTGGAGQEGGEGDTVNCKICDKVFKKSYIKLHIRKHTGEKPELCKVCGRGFSSITNLARHMMIHTGEKRFKCDECDRSFIQKVDYEAHMRRKHTGERPYECEVCDKRFFEFSVLHRHKKTRSHQLALQHAAE